MTMSWVLTGLFKDRMYNGLKTICQFAFLPLQTGGFGSTLVKFY